MGPCIFFAGAVGILLAPTRSPGATHRMLTYSHSTHTLRFFTLPCKEILPPYIRQQYFFAGAVGIEPTLKVLETLVLPLYYAPFF